MQVVKFKWNVSRDITGEPVLSVREDKDLAKIGLLGTPIDMKLGKKTCIGYSKKGKSYQCPGKREVSYEKMCRECVLNDDFFLCVKCDGSECINENQRDGCIKNNYFIYLAAFNTMLKVGISHEFRLLERLVEQGADMGAKIGMVRDGKIARQAEQKIRRELDILDRVSGEQKTDMLFGNINAASINIFNAYSKLRNNGLSQYLVYPEIYNLQGIYRLANVSSSPVPLALGEGTEIKGHVVAAKGNILVVKNGKGFFSVNANRLVGFEIASENNIRNN